MFVLFVEELAISELRKHVCIPIVSTRYLCFIRVHWLGWLRFRPPIIFLTTLCQVCEGLCSDCSFLFQNTRSIEVLSLSLFTILIVLSFYNSQAHIFT